ncbi:hypothetical protein R6Q57_001423 [Mikania cordata]
MYLNFTQVGVWQISQPHVQLTVPTDGSSMWSNPSLSAIEHEQLRSCQVIPNLVSLVPTIICSDLLPLYRAAVSLQLEVMSVGF